MSIECENFVHAKQVEAIYAQSITAIISNPLAAILIVFIFENIVNGEILFTWLACTIVVSILKTYLHIKFRKKKHNDDSIKRWGNFFILMSSLQGTIWGIAWLMFIPAKDPIYLVIITAWIIGLSAVAVSAYSGYLKALLAYFIPVVLPGTAHLLIIGGQYGTTLGLAITLYSIIILRAILPINKSILNATRLNFKLENEINERKKIETKLQELSIKDELTGLYNRRHFNKVLESEIQTAQRSSTPLSLIFIDIDNFKHFNDTFGHIEGDVCLQKVSLTIKNVTKRQGDLTFRYGGEEIAVILPNTNSNSAYSIAEKIRTSVKGLEITHEDHSSKSSFVTISSGLVTVIPQMNTSPTDIINKADNALYQAKHSGKNQVEVFID
jgi:diguanylate cyclase (GGDEF)-like protein